MAKIISHSKAENQPGNHQAEFSISSQLWQLSSHLQSYVIEISKSNMKSEILKTVTQSKDKNHTKNNIDCNRTKRRLNLVEYYSILCMCKRYEKRAKELCMKTGKSDNLD